MFLKHAKSGLYVQPEARHAAIGTKLVLAPGPHRNAPDLKFDFRSDGSLIHVHSGLAVHVAKMSSGAELLLQRDSPERRCQFSHDKSEGFFCLRNGSSSLFSSALHVHPSTGKGGPGVFLMLHPDGPAKAFKGELEYRFEPEYEALVEGSLLHCRSGLYVHPLGGTGVCGVKLVLHHDQPQHLEQRLLFTLRADGNLQHTESGLFVHPFKGTAHNGCPLVLHTDGPERRLAFQTMHASDLVTSGVFTHALTGLCVVPKDGQGVSGCELIFTDDVEAADADFRFVTASETKAKADFAADLGEAAAAAAGQAHDALQRRGEQLQQTAERSQRLQAASEVFADNAAQLRKDEQKKSSFWPF